MSDPTKPNEANQASTKGTAIIDTPDGPVEYKIQDLVEAVTHCAEPTDAVSMIPSLRFSAAPYMTGQSQLISYEETATTSNAPDSIIASTESSSGLPSGVDKTVAKLPRKAPTLPKPTVTLPLDENGKICMEAGYKLLGGKSATGSYYFYVVSDDADENEVAKMCESQADEDIDYPCQSLMQHGGPECELERRYRLEFRNGQLVMKAPKPTFDHFNYAEHFLLGSMLQLWFEENVPTKAQNYALTLEHGNELKLLYGQMNGLGGDFFGTYDPICLGNDFGEQKRRFRAAFASLAKKSGRTAGEVKKILANREKEVTAVWRAVNEGESTADAYKTLSSSSALGGLADEFELNKMTLSRPDRGQEGAAPAYIMLAQMNLDHFGRDAQLAYNAGHSCALETAAAAASKEDLEIAYAMNGFADHYLADCFAAGHIRTPRRELHEPSANPLYFFRDLCSKYMHDEDNALGLWVQNRRGEWWKSYGDKQMFEQKNRRNQQLLLECQQASVDEVFEAYSSHKVDKNPSDYAAWEIAPILESAFDHRNHSPLFIKHGDGVLIRDDISDSKCRKHVERQFLGLETPWPATYTKLRWDSKLSQY